MLTDKPYQFETLPLKCRNCLELLVGICLERPTYSHLQIFSHLQILLNANAQLLTALRIKMNTHKLTHTQRTQLKPCY
jgi:hypothetical protein